MWLVVDGKDDFLLRAYLPGVLSGGFCISFLRRSGAMWLGGEPPGPLPTGLREWVPLGKAFPFCLLAAASEMELTVLADLA